MSIDGGLRPIFRQHLREFHWTSIETGGTGQGIADSNYLHSGGIEGWVEYKLTDTMRIKETESWPFQVSWLFRRARLGGRATVAVRRRHAGGPRLGAPVDELWLVPGAHAPLLRAEGLAAFAELPFRGAHRMAGGPALWDWPAVARALLAAPLAPAIGAGSPAGDVRREPGVPGSGKHRARH